MLVSLVLVFKLEVYLTHLAQDPLTAFAEDDNEASVSIKVVYLLNQHWNH
jgi:hypothetical protein